MLHKLQEYFGDALLILSSPGVASLVMFRSRGGEILKIVDDDDHDDNIAMERLTKRVRKESEAFREKRNSYSTRINKDSVSQAGSPTLMSFLSHISSKLDKTLPSLLICNMITSIITNTATDLQIVLGLLVREKSLINHLKVM